MKNRGIAFVLSFKEISIKDIPLVGGKNASLGEMYRNLSKKEADGLIGTIHNSNEASALFERYMNLFGVPILSNNQKLN